LPGILSAYDAVARKRPAESGDPTAYTMDHTARTYLVDPSGRLFLSYSFGTPVEDVASDIRQLLQTSNWHREGDESMGGARNNPVVDHSRRALGLSSCVPLGSAVAPGVTVKEPGVVRRWEGTTARRS